MEPRLKICSYLWMADGDVVWCAHLITHCRMVVVAVYAVLCTWSRQHWGSLLQPVPEGPGSPAVKRLWCTIKPKSRYFCVSWPHKKRTEVKYWRLPYWHSPRGSSSPLNLQTWRLCVYFSIFGTIPVLDSFCTCTSYFFIILSLPVFCTTTYTVSHKREDA